MTVPAPSPGGRLDGLVDRAVANPVVTLSVLLMAGVIAAVGMSILSHPPGGATGGDFAVFHTAGEWAGADRLSDVYEGGFVTAVNEKAGLDDSNLVFLNPPVAAQVMQPFAAVSYGSAFLVWTALTLVATALALRWMRAPMEFWVLALVLPPAVLNLELGQNGAISLLVLTGVYRVLRTDRLVLGGLVASLLIYKPTLALGLGVWWVLRCRSYWRALAGASVGGTAIVVASIATVGAEPWRRFMETVSSEGSGSGTWFTTASVTPWEFWRELLVGAEWLVLPLWLFVAAAGVWGFARFLRATPGRPEVHLVGAVALTPWLAPHVLVYDWMILFLPAVVLWTEFPGQRRVWLNLGSLLVVASVVWRSSSAQMEAFGRALHIGLVLYAWVLVRAAMVVVRAVGSAGDERADPVLGSSDDGSAVLDHDGTLHQAGMLQ